MSTELLAVTFGLASAATWGASDFSGGFAARRCNVYSVILISQLISLALLLVTALVLRLAFPSSYCMALGSIAGILGVIGLAALYKGLSTGCMGVVAPVSALVSALLPVAFSLFKDGLLPAHQFMGIVMALIGVWLLSGGDANRIPQMRQLLLPVISGLAFGMFFIIIDNVSETAILWPMISARMTSIVLMLWIVVSLPNIKVPASDQLPAIVLAGIFDICGNVFFALATRIGRLDISSILASFFPATTVLLARAILKEQLTLQQRWGVIAAAISLMMLSA